MSEKMVRSHQWAPKGYDMNVNSNYETMLVLNAAYRRRQEGEVVEANVNAIRQEAKTIEAHKEKMKEFVTPNYPPHIGSVIDVWV